MKAFKIVPSIAEYVDFRTLAKELKPRRERPDSDE